jgi:hypothetical protein
MSIKVSRSMDDAFGRLNKFHKYKACSRRTLSFFKKKKKYSTSIAPGTQQNVDPSAQSVTGSIAA